MEKSDLKQLIQSAEAGNADDMYELYRFYLIGNEVPRDIEASNFWLRKAAEFGHADAQYYMGFSSEHGWLGVKIDYNDAFKWYTRAATQNHSNAQWQLGLMYQNGNGVTKNIHQAMRLYQASALQENATGQYYLGMCYYKGNGTVQDYKKAVFWLEKASENGDDDAKCLLGYCYENGLGVEKNIEKALSWYQDAIECGIEEAEERYNILIEQQRNLHNTLDPLLNQLLMLVKQYPGNTGRFYARVLRDNGYTQVTRTDVNHYLYKYKDQLFLATFDEISRPSWYIKKDTKTEKIITTAPQVSPARSSEQDQFVWKSDVSFDLWDWQVRALNKWQDAKHVGVITAITGSGKTRVGIAALEAHINKGWQILILVHKIVLQEQWIEEITSLLGPSYSKRIGRVGNGFNDSFNQYDIIVAMVQTECKNPSQLKAGKKGLIIADECHHYNASVWFAALQNRFIRRLGLTATLDPDDAGKQNDNLITYFGRDPVYELEFGEAIDDDIISHFNITFVGTKLSAKESKEYETSQKKMDELFGKLNKLYDSKRDGKFFEFISRLAKHGSYPANFRASAYLGAYTKRRNAIIESTSRYDAFKRLFDNIRRSKKAFVFTETIQVSNRLADLLNSQGIWSVTLDSELSDVERDQRLYDFGNDERCKVIVAPKLLDEGVNIPSADLAIIFASTKSKRQMIQRVGRVLRKAPGKMAEVIILYAIGTYEDPKKGAHEAFLDLVTEAADEIKFD